VKSVIPNTSYSQSFGTVCDASLEIMNFGGNHQSLYQMCYKEFKISGLVTRVVFKKCTWRYCC